jgi:hypothetical protein
MDEFFDFENAIQQIDHLEDPMTGPCDMDLALAELPQAEDALAQFNQFEDPVPQDQLNLALHGPRVGARFSWEALRILRTLLSSNHRHPYPSDEEKREPGSTDWSKQDADHQLAGKCSPQRKGSGSSASSIHLSNFTMASTFPKEEPPS